MARHLSPHARILAHDPARDDAAEAAEEAGCLMVDLAHAAGCAVVILAVPVGQVGPVCAAIAKHLNPGALVIDVGSVKVAPVRAMLRELPEYVDILGTHPLFGPQSAREGIAGHRIALCPVRGQRAWRIGAFLRAKLGLKVLMSTPEAHDREVAVIQGLTHLIGKLMVSMEPLPQRMATASFDTLMRSVDMVRHDSDAVFNAIEQANPYASGVRERFFDLAQRLKLSLELQHDAAGR